MKKMTFVINVPSGSRPAAMKTWLGNILSGHKMTIDSVVEGEPETFASEQPNTPDKAASEELGARITEIDSAKEAQIRQRPIEDHPV